MRHRLAAAIVAVALSTAAVATPALADGDPASDVLLGQSVFFPYQPAVSKDLMKRLEAETAAAANAHFPIKVALIASPLDLGVVPSLFGQPQNYAHFLEQEISFQGPPLLLVVMPNGYGVEGLPKASTAAVAELTKPSTTGATSHSDALAQAALTAVQKLAAAAGHQLPNLGGRSTSQSGSGGLSTNTVVVIVLVLAAVATAGALIAVRRRQPT